MGIATGSNAERAPDEQVMLRRLLPPGEPATAQQIADQLELSATEHSPPARPYVLLNMISTADGRASIEGQVLGLDESANLLVKTASGEVRSLAFLDCVDLIDARPRDS